MAPESKSSITAMPLYGGGVVDMEAHVQALALTLNLTLALALASPQLHLPNPDLPVCGGPV
jgi:hypothetical protein